MLNTDILNTDIWLTAEHQARQGQSPFQAYADLWREFTEYPFEELNQPSAATRCAALPVAAGIQVKRIPGVRI